MTDDPPGHRAGWCIHYRYRVDPDQPGPAATCKAGVDYAALNGGTRDNMISRLPCFIHASDPPGWRLECASFTPPTAEGIHAREKWWQQKWETLADVLTAILPWRKQHQGTSFSEIVTCPACEGRLHLTIAATNSHVHGACETDGCVKWME